jgi:hypothetical protein
MMKNISSALNRISSPVMIILFCMAAIEQFCQSFSWGHNNWCMNECLINYAGGFVRRGLFGQVALEFSKCTGIPANIFVILTCLIMLLAFIAFFFWKSSGRLPGMVLFSPLLLGCAIFQDFAIRKDVLCIVLLITCFLIEKSKYGILVRNLLINSVAIIAVLCHEGFIFYGFLAIVAVRYFSQQEKMYKSLACFSPVFIVFLVTSYFHGNESTAVAINQSLIRLWHHIEPNNVDIYNPSCAIYSLKYNFNNCPWNGYSLLWEVNYHVYTPLAWTLTLLFCVIYLSSNIQCDKKITIPTPSSVVIEKSRLQVILIIQLVFISPLFVIGWDYGRWIFLWIASSVSLYFLGLNWSHPFLERSTARAIQWNRLFRLPWIPQQWHLLFFGIPLCSWSIFSYLQATPFGYQADYFLRFFLHKSLFETIYPLVRLHG